MNHKTVSWVLIQWQCDTRITSLGRSTRQLQLRVPSGQSSNRLPRTVWFSSEDGGVTSEHWNVTALICHNANTSLTIYGNICLDTNKPKIHLIGMATFKKIYASCCMTFLQNNTKNESQHYLKSFGSNKLSSWAKSHILFSSPIEVFDPTNLQMI